MIRFALCLTAALPFCAAQAATSATVTGDLAVSIVIAGQPKVRTQITSASAVEAAKAAARITIIREGDTLVKEIYY